MTATDAEPRGWGLSGRRRLAFMIITLVPALALVVVIGVRAFGYAWLGAVAGVLGVLGVLIVLSWIAMDRFDWFIWTVLLVRPLVDSVKPDASAAGQSSGPLATLLGAILIIAGTVWFAAVSRRGERLPMGFVSRALILMTVTSLISVALSEDPVASFGQVARTTGAVVLFVVLEQLIRTRPMALRTLAVCGLAAAIPLLIGLVQIPLRGTSGDASRISSVFFHPNVFGFFLVMLILIIYPLRGYVPYRMRRWMWLVMLLSLVELVTTGSRGGWISLVIGFGAIAVIAKEERRKLLWIGPALAVLLTVAFPTILQRLSDLSQPETLAGRPGNSATWRVQHYETLLHNTDISLFGIGPRMTDTLTEGGRPPHNDYLRLLLENGVIGLVFYLLFIASLVLLARHGLRCLRTGFDRSLGIGFMAVVVAFTCDSFGANVITSFVLLIYLLALAAIIQALAQLTAGAATPVDTIATVGATSVLDEAPGQ